MAQTSIKHKLEVHNFPSTKANNPPTTGAHCYPVTPVAQAQGQTFVAAHCTHHHTVAKAMKSQKPAVPQGQTASLPVA
jgi:hypothetical protein